MIRGDVMVITTIVATCQTIPFVPSLNPRVAAIPCIHTMLLIELLQITYFIYDSAI